MVLDLLPFLWLMLDTGKSTLISFRNVLTREKLCREGPQRSQG
jgi:hypothetical protein